MFIFSIIWFFLRNEFVFVKILIYFKIKFWKLFYIWLYCYRKKKSILIQFFSLKHVLPQLFKHDLIAILNFAVFSIYNKKYKQTFFFSFSNSLHKITFPKSNRKLIAKAYQTVFVIWFKIIFNFFLRLMIETKSREERNLPKVRNES